MSLFPLWWFAGFAFVFGLKLESEEDRFSIPNLLLMAAWTYLIWAFELGILVWKEYAKWRAKYLGF